MGAVRVYVAHMLHRLVEWAIRFCPKQVATRVAGAEALLREL